MFVVPRNLTQRREIGDRGDVRIPVSLGGEVATVARRARDQIGLIDVNDPEDVAHRHAVLEQLTESGDRYALAAHDPVGVGAAEDDGVDATVAQSGQRRLNRGGILTGRDRDRAPRGCVTHATALWASAAGSLSLRRRKPR